MAPINRKMSSITININQPSSEEQRECKEQIAAIESNGHTRNGIRETKVSFSADSIQQDCQKASFRQMLCSWRFIIIILLQGSLMVSLLPKLSMGMALICMVRPTRSSANNASFQTSMVVTNMTSLSTGQSEREYMTSSTNDSSIVIEQIDDGYEFDWSSDTIGLLLSSPNFSQFLSALISDFMRGYIGNKWTLAIAYGLSASLLYASPTAARASPYALMGLVVMQGLVVNSSFTVAGDTAAWWSPANEKMTFSAIMFSGSYVAGILGNFISGILCTITYDNGWPFIFYTFGSVTLTWVLMWILFSSRSPEEHKFVSEEEKQYIISTRAGMKNANASKVERPPYKKMFRSAPFWAFMITGWCFIWTLTSYFNYSPIFFSKVQGFSPQETGMLVSIVSACGFMSNFIWAAIGNHLRSRFGASKSRKMMMVTGYYLAASCYVSISIFITTASKWVIYGLQISSTVFGSVGSVTLAVITLDMAPRYAGFLNAIWMSSSTLISISGPLSISQIASNNTLEEWRVVFGIFGCVMFFGSTVFLIFGDSALQPWANPELNKSPKSPSDLVKTTLTTSSNGTTHLSQENHELKTTNNNNSIKTENGILHNMHSKVQTLDTVHYNHKQEHISIDHDKAFDQMMADEGVDNEGFEQGAIDLTRVIKDIKPVTDDFIDVRL